MASRNQIDGDDGAALVRAVEIRVLDGKLRGAVLRRAAPAGAGEAAGESLHLGRDGVFVRESGAGVASTLRARGRWAVEDFLDAPALVLRQEGAVSTFLPIVVAGHAIEILGGVAWTREAAA